MPKFGDHLTAKGVLRPNKSEQRNGINIPNVKNIGYNKTYIELETVEVVRTSCGAVYPKVVKVALDGFVSFRTLKRRFGRGLKSFYYEDSRTDRWSFLYQVEDVRGILTFWWQAPKNFA